MINFAEAYQRLSDDEILRLAADRENLLEEARQVLDGELRRRGLTASSIAEYQCDVEQAGMRQQLGNLPFMLPYGLGKRLYGKRARAVDPRSRWEEFDTTLWMIIFWVPLIPIATYRVRRPLRKTVISNPLASYKFTAVCRKDRDWRLILPTWGWFCLTVVALIGVLWILERLRFP
ncbi:MAG TPA: hypothetical protein VGK36_22885 [Candidatus Angelobacter sp.]|jgi:hypothetical protein